MPIDTLLIEASGKLGGKIQTVRKDGFTIERGPDSFLARKESAARLVKELGLGDELVNNQAGQSFILVNNRLHKMPSINDGNSNANYAVSIFWAVLPIGKLRAGFDLLMPRSKPVSDQSLGHFSDIASEMKWLKI